MKKYVAVIEMTSWMGTHQHIVRGDSASELLSEFEEIQSLNCLVRMGRMEENASGQKQLDKLRNYGSIGTIWTLSSSKYIKIA